MHRSNIVPLRKMISILWIDCHILWHGEMNYKYYTRRIAKRLARNNRLVDNVNQKYHSLRRGLDTLRGPTYFMRIGGYEMWERALDEVYDHPNFCDDAEIMQNNELTKWVRYMKKMVKRMDGFDRERIRNTFPVIYGVQGSLIEGTTMKNPVEFENQFQQIHDEQKLSWIFTRLSEDPLRVWSL